MVNSGKNDTSQMRELKWKRGMMMLTIQNLLKNLYCCIKNISKKFYRNCAILVSGVTVLALIFLNTQGFQGAGKNRIVRKCGIAQEMEEKEKEEDGEEFLQTAGGGFAMACQLLLEEGQSGIRERMQAEISRREVTTVCTSVEPIYNEVQQEPVNPYGELDISDQDYEALCRIVQAEAGGEDEKGKILVAEVILNRVLSGKFADTVYDVIFECTGGSPQFSPTVDGRYFSVTVTSETIEAVEQALHGEDFSQGALFFSARSKAEPNDMAWFDRNLKWLFLHGGHEFYTLP